MILAWRYNIDREAGRANQGRYVLVDTLFPWPALHYGRENIRHWKAAQAALRGRGIPGPIDAGYGLTTAVCEDGDAVMRVWPIETPLLPRPWNDVLDQVWRDPLRELRRWIGHDLACGVRLEWMPGGGTIERVQTVPSLKNRRGYWGWRRGEREPTEKITRSISRQLGAQIAGYQPRSMVGPSAGFITPIWQT